MLDEIIPALKHHQGSEILEAEPQATGLFPQMDSKISFLPFINYLHQKKEAVSDIQSGIYNYLIEKFEARPALLDPVEDVQLLNGHTDLLELLSTMLFPVISKNEKNSFALAAPYEFRVFYYSDCFKKLFLDDTEQHLLLPDDMSAEQLRKIQSVMIYDHVLEKFYGIKLNDSPELVYPIADEQTGMKRYYKIRYDNRFIDVHLKGVLPPIQDCAVCLNTFRILDLDVQLKKMPLSLFEIEGLAVWVAEDVTTNESLENIKRILLHQGDCDTGIISEMKSSIQALIGLNNVEVGLMPFIRINNEFVLEEDCMSNGILSRSWKVGDQHSIANFQMFLQFLTEHPEPAPITNLSEQMVQFAPPLQPLYDSGIRSYLCYPMQNSEGLLGILELASTVPGLITHEVMARLEPAMPLVSLAMLKNRNDFHNRIEKLIKEKFTALQQSVEWKFEEVAWNYLRNPGNNSSAANVIFENVYPLYGAIDIRNSSLERTIAIQKDLKEHLLLIDDVLEQLQSKIHLPLFEGLMFKNQNIQKSIKETMAAEDEVRINEFIKTEVEPVLSHLQTNNKPAKDIVDHYFKVVDDTNSGLYQNRREYEKTLGTINDVVLQYLEHQEEGIQQSYPHYFERYRTDGVEYNIYIGQSIAPNFPFDLLYLKNIRLWQLRSMAEAACLTNKLLPELKVPLQTTQLILVQNQSISISFRRDERRFDVEGSYNIRYEIIKKRLDKALIKDTSERLTQPGKIAIVYSNQKEVQEYQQYIEFLQNKDIIKPGIEFLELEELQGIKGMKAMRVEINMDSENLR
jgi:hypothetical protein